MFRKSKKLLPHEFFFADRLTEKQWDIGILVCGCLTACADKPDFKNLARKWIIVTGNSADLNNALEKEIAGIVVGKVKKLQ